MAGDKSMEIGKTVPDNEVKVTTTTPSTPDETPHSADPALLPENQHHHAHHHHTAFAEQDHEDDVVYAKDVTFEKNGIPEPSPLDHSGNSQSDKDVEGTGENYPQSSWKSRCRRYTRHWRHVVHAAIWILFTG